MLTSLDEDWRLISDYIDLLSETDQESKNIGDKILQNLLPYSIRQSQIERTNLLIQAQQDLESQISFINENKTRDLVFLKQFPQCTGMTLYAVSSANNHYRVIKNL